LPEGIRVTLPGLLALAGIMVLGFGIRQRRKLSERRVARLFETSYPALGDQLTNAVQLSADESHSAVGECLRRDAIALGHQAATGLKTWDLVRRAVVIACALLGSVLLAWLVLLWLGADVLHAVIPRLVDPRGDHPPFSRLKFAVTPGGAEVIFGGQLEVRAKASGKPVEKLWLVARNGTNETRASMFLAPDRSYFQTLVNLRSPGEYFVTDGTARSRRFPVHVRYTPLITLVEVSAKFPDYTGQPARTNRLGNEAQAFPEGTRFGIRMTSNRPLKSGNLSLTPVLGGRISQLQLSPDSIPGVVTGAFTLAEPVAFALSVRDADGLESADSKRGRFNISPDEKPKLFVLEPGRDAVATPSIRVPVRVQASDDYGIAKVVWLRGLNRSIERPFSMKLTLKNGAQSVESVGGFELAQWGVRPGDVIEYYFEAADNYPKGPNLALSRPFRLEVISPEQYEAILRQQSARKTLFEPYLKLGAWLGRLAERSNDLGVEAEKSQQSARQQAEALARDLEQYEQELGKLLRDAVTFDLEESFRKSLVAEHTRLGQTRAKLRQALAAGKLDPKQLGEVSDELNEMAQRERDSVGEPAEQIASVMQVLARADTFVKLARQQAVLTQMLRRFSDRTDALSRLEQVEVQELAHQQRRIHEGLVTYLKELPELVTQVPAATEFDPLRKDVEEFLKAVQEAKIETDLSDATIALSEPDVVAGHALAQRAAEKMDKLIGRCQQTAGKGMECLVARFQPKLMQEGLGQALAQILAAMGVGEHGRDGYGMFNEDVALYGPNVQLNGQQAAGRGETGGGQGRSRATVGSDANDPGLPPANAAGRVRLQPDAKFPLRYRDLVGEYFRAIAESTEEHENEK
jgi:hypothetical protein